LERDIASLKHGFKLVDKVYRDIVKLDESQMEAKGDLDKVDLKHEKAEDSM